MKRAICIILFSFVGLFVGTSFAGEINVFGPKKYVRTKGKPVVYTDTFSALSVPAKGKIIIKNGDEDGSNRFDRGKHPIGSTEEQTRQILNR